MRSPFIAIAASFLLSAGCTALFDSSEEDQGPFSDEDRPLYQFKFDKDVDMRGAFSSTGQLELEMELRGKAHIEDGALQLMQPGVSPRDSAIATSPITDAIEACRYNRELTIATWLTADRKVTKALPARIFSIEIPAGETSVTLGQGPQVGNYDWMITRLGTSKEAVLSGESLDNGVPQFVFFTVDQDGIYTSQVGNTIPDQDSAPTNGDYWNWPMAGSELTLGDVRDQGDRPWRGLVHHFEFYCRVLSEDERVLVMNSSDPR